MKIIVLCLANDENGYDQMVKACRNTWGSISAEGLKIYYIYGHRNGIEKQDQTFAIEDCIYSPTPEGRHNLFIKTINAFEWLLNNEEFDYILRCNCGSYVDLKILQQACIDRGIRDNIYAGEQCEFSGIKYASGAAFLISHNLVKDIVSDKHQISYIEMDDVTIGRYLTQYKNILPIPIGTEKYKATHINLYDENLYDPHKITQNLDHYFHYYFNQRIVGKNSNLPYVIHQIKQKIK